MWGDKGEAEVLGGHCLSAGALGAPHKLQPCGVSSRKRVPPLLSRLAWVGPPVRGLEPKGEQGSPGKRP